MRILLTLPLLICSCLALFEDQVGKFDWRVKSLGCPLDLSLDGSSSEPERLVVLTRSNVVASVSINSGQIDWRQLNEEALESGHSTLITNRDDVLVIVNGGEYLRLFDKATGALVWQQRLLAENLRREHVFFKKNFHAILTPTELQGFGKKAELVWRAKLESGGEYEPIGILSAGNFVALIERSKSEKLRITFYAIANGNKLDVDIDATALNAITAKECAFSASTFACIDGRSLHSIFFTAEGAKFALAEFPNGASELKPMTVANTFKTRHGDRLSIVSVNEARISRTTVDIGVVTASARFVLVYVESTRKLRIYERKSGQNIGETALRGGDEISAIEQMRVLELDDGRVLQFVAARADCRIEAFEVQLVSKDATLQWTRLEGLASISSVEMLDLPLTNVLHDLIGANKKQTSARPRAGTLHAESGAQLQTQRDKFNLHKLIVVSTLSGSVYALHSEFGVVVWSLWLGTQFEPLTTSRGAPRVPLFIQRQTAYEQHESQAAVVYKLKGTSKTRIVVFNPATGQVLNSHTIDSVKHVELAPFTTCDMLNPLIVIDASNRASYVPPMAAAEVPQAQRPHHFGIDLKSGVMSGYIIPSDKSALIPTWSTKLSMAPDEKIVAIATKRRSERVHSQGKVLGDRNVLYKYANPNLVAILTVDKVHTTVVLHLVDAVSGAVRYTAKQERATTPVHLVLCENWAMYTYWNERSRRTEIGIVEAYEGLNQTNTKYFNSYTALREPLSVVANTFIFPQGISAIATSETEQGLTTRSVIVAMPFGGILEISKRILDARRTMEMTPELREEMLIPYMPEIPIATEDLVNYNQTVMQITGIKTAASGLESTSLMFAYGLDLFYTRLTPSGTFDVLKDDFDYLLISIVLASLVIASLVFRRISRYQTLKQAWA